MDELGCSKRRKRSVKHKKSKETKGHDLTKNSSPRISASKLVRSVNKTQRLYERHSTNQNITQKRMIIRPGIFNRGKCSSFVHRAVNLSPEKKARMDEDLHRLIQLANDDSSLRPPSCENIRKRVEESTIQNKRLDKRLKSVGNEDSQSEDTPTDVIKENESNQRQKEITSSSRKVKKSLENSSSSSSSSCEYANSVQIEGMNYSDPPLEVYEEFAESIVSALVSKRKSIFPCRDYLEEVRSAIKAHCNISQSHSMVSEEQTDPSVRETTAEEKVKENARGLQSKKNSPPMRIDQAVGSPGNFPPAQSHIASCREFSPVSFSLSPKTTILNPIEYLKRVENTSKQAERHTNDNWHEKKMRNYPNLSGSQCHMYSNDYYGNCNLFNGAFSSDDSNFQQSGTANQKVIYRHSNRSYIDSPQAVQFEKAKFLAPQLQSQHLYLNDIQDTHNFGDMVQNNPIRHSMHNRRIGDAEVDRKHLGFQYLMNVSALPEVCERYNCCDLLDDLDAADSNLITDNEVICASSTKGKQKLNKWCPPPPTPDIGEHKFYRRKMF